MSSELEETLHSVIQNCCMLMELTKCTKKYHCRYCKKYFKDSYILKLHKRIYSSESL